MAMDSSHKPNGITVICGITIKFTLEYYASYILHKFWNTKTWPCGGSAVLSAIKAFDKEHIIRLWNLHIIIKKQDTFMISKQNEYHNFFLITNCYKSRWF